MYLDTRSPFFNWAVAQLAHFAWGWLLTDMSAHWGLPFPTLTLAWALPKEYLFDTFVEHDSQLSNTVDLAFYLTGTLVRRLLLG